jgi:hypothetical protein
MRSHIVYVRRLAEIIASPFDLTLERLFGPCIHCIDVVGGEFRILLLEWLADTDPLWNGLNPAPTVSGT